MSPLLVGSNVKSTVILVVSCVSFMAVFVFAQNYGGYGTVVGLM